MGILIDGKVISNSIKESLKIKINKLKEKGVNINLSLILVGEDENSKIYVNSIKKQCNDVGIGVLFNKFSSDIDEKNLIDFIIKQNNDNKINGIFLLVPLPKHFNQFKIINTINSKKDIDGVNAYNVGLLLNGKDCFVPCTPLGIVTLLEQMDINVSGKHCVIVGRSNVVGKPLMSLLLNKDATVTICHSKTYNLKQICMMADILIVATNIPKFIDGSFIKKDCIVVDVGIHNMNVDGEIKICGDVDFDDCVNKCSYITPVPGGVGPMTVTMLISNLYKTVENV